MSIDEVVVIVYQGKGPMDLCSVYAKHTFLYHLLREARAAWPLGSTLTFVDSHHAPERVTSEPSFRAPYLSWLMEMTCSTSRRFTILQAYVSPLGKHGGRPPPSKGVCFLSKGEYGERVGHVRFSLETDDYYALFRVQDVLPYVPRPSVRHGPLELAIIGRGRGEAVRKANLEWESDELPPSLGR